jgi:hypothetical protein
MNNHTIGNLTRISKSRARKLWAQDKIIHFCPVKLRPGLPFASDIAYYPEEQKNNDFNKTVLNFEWYNCQMNETGYYTAFYLRTK